MATTASRLAHIHAANPHPSLTHTPLPAGPWNPEAQELLGRLLPITHLLHAAGSQEAPPAPKPKAPGEGSSRHGSSRIVKS